MFKLFHSCHSLGLLALVVTLNSAATFALSASNEDAVKKPSLVDYFQQPETFKQALSEVTRLRKKKNLRLGRECIPSAMDSKPSEEALEELNELKEDVEEASAVYFSEFPILLGEVEENCASKDGEVYYFSVNSICLSDIVPKLQLPEETVLYMTSRFAL